ncbi:TRAP transporter small permease [Thalassobacillus sp. CUG 92003]|uniref:TRAP transporter small permease n=1 Tax=Thalassobacillus sp. CUG 92003 TaxID=2736641 RepID=UPI0015E68E54|nr:TRAP transporter small permease [Thalassobacillus sp. CUG 92003]
MKLLDKISYWLDWIVRKFITIFLIVMTTILALQIIERSVFNGGYVWTDELSRFLMIALVFFGAAVAMRDNSHITVSVLEELKPSLSRWLAPAKWVVMLAYSVILVKYGIDTLDIVGPQQSPNMGLSMGVVYAILPVSGAIMIVHLIARIGKKPSSDNEVKE